MTLSRYKIMAGVLGVSIGGLAAVAGPCPRPDTPHRSGDAPAGDPKMPNAGSKPAALPAIPDVTALPTPAPISPVGVDLPTLPLPALPTVPTAVPPTAPSKLPDLPPITPVKAEVPKVPSIPTPVVVPAAGALPELPPAPPATVLPEKAAPKAPAVPTPPAFEPAPPVAAQPAPMVLTPPPSVPPAALVPTPSVDQAPVTRPAPVQAQQAVPPPPAPATRFRILLRVGEGEPTFEVKSGDDLVMRVVCEKVDIKSPDKGTGPSSVIASGRVRFVGFGAEGSCDSLSFLAGTGEVSMTGAVRVQVKDKIGRVESELTSDRLQYRLDAANLPGVMRP